MRKCKRRGAAFSTKTARCTRERLRRVYVPRHGGLHAVHVHRPLRGAVVQVAPVPPLVLRKVGGERGHGRGGALAVGEAVVGDHDLVGTTGGCSHELVACELGGQQAGLEEVVRKAVAAIPTWGSGGCCTWSSTSFAKSQVYPCVTSTAGTEPPS
jgi:hypothetical protein